MRIATFNVQNLRLRPRADGAALDGAVDGDMEGAPDPALDRIDRRLTAAVIREADADVVALQEVFDRAALDHFNDRFLAPAGAAYRHRVCLPGNDGRGLNVALLSRTAPAAVESHAALTPADLGLDAAPRDRDRPVFRRDCLEARIGRLTLFVCHFKAPYPDIARAWAVRRMEAAAVRALIARRFPDPAGATWLVAGDLNEPADAGAGAEAALAPLTSGFAVDLMARLPEAARWTIHVPGTERYARPDALLASPALAAAYASARPRVLRMGLDAAAARYEGRRLPEVGPERPHASDHAAVAIDFPGL